MQLGSIYLKDKEAAIPEVRRWLLDTYKVVPGSMVPKKQVYDAYRAFCASCDFEPSDVSSFGKIFKRVFPDVERKRLVKGWHYNNLAPQANDTTSSLSSSTPSAGGTEDSSPAAAPGDRLYHSDPVVPTASSRGGARRHLATRPLSPLPPRPHSRSASPVSGAPTHFTTSFTAIPTARSRSPSPSSAIVRRAHSQSPVSSSHHIRTRAHTHTAPLLSPAPLRPTAVSPHLFHPVPLYHPPPSNLQPAQHHQQHQLPPHPPAPHQQQHQPYPLTQHAIFHHHQHHPSYSPQPLPHGHQYHPQAWAGPPPQQLHANAPAGASFSPSLGPLLEAAGHHHVRRNRSRPHDPAEVEMAEGEASSGSREDPSGAAAATTTMTMPTTTTTTTTTPTSTLVAPSSSPGTSMLDAWAVSAGTHMQLTSELEYYVSVYQREMWGLHPVNPAALGTELLQYLQTTEDGARERTPLTMCSLFALSMGCTLAGDFRRGREYLNKLRLQVSQLFDESNYDVACVLRHLPLLVRFYAETEQGRENNAYYLTLSQQICAHIGAVNDENYLITLKMLSIYERLDIDDKITAALSQPRWRKRWARDDPFIENYKYGKLTEMARDYLYEIPKNVLLLLDPPSTNASPKPLHDGIIEQLSRIDEWETSVSDLQETYGAIHTLRLVRAAIFLLRTTCHTAIHQTDDALESATDFVQLLLELMRPYQIICFIELSSKTVYTHSLLQTLLHAGRYDQIQELTELALSLAQEFGAINAFCQFMLNSLSAHQHRLRGGAPPSSPMISSMPSPSVTLMITSAPPSPPSVTVPPPPLPSFPLYTTPHAMPTLPPLLLPPGLHDPSSSSSSSSSSPSSASSSSISSTPVPQHYSSSMPSMIAPERPEDHDVESLHAYLSSFLDQNM